MSDLKRRRAASAGGYARIATGDPEELAAMRAKGGAARAAQTRGDSSWGKYLAERKRLKRHGASVPTTQELLERVAALERRLG